jgi:hypothetical protein
VVKKPNEITRTEIANMLIKHLQSELDIDEEWDVYQLVGGVFDAAYAVAAGSPDIQKTMAITRMALRK